MKEVSLKGVIISGKGEAAFFVKLPWVKQQMKQKLGFLPFSGTLNLKLLRESIVKKRVLHKSEGLEFISKEGFESAKLFRAVLLNGIRCGLVIPSLENYPEDLAEIVAPENLRSKFHLDDGDDVELLIRV